MNRISKKPLVSVLIVTWNRRTALEQAILSVLQQDYPSLEIIVVDNASSDGTADMVRTDFPEVRLLSADKNLGCPSGRNLGIAHCNGDYAYLLDDDGILERNAISLAVGRAESNPSLGVVLSARIEANESDLRTLPGQHPVYQASFIGCCALIRTAALRQIGLFPDDFFRQAEEEDLAIRMLDAGWYCFLEPRSVMHHARNGIGRDQKEFNFFSIRNTTKTGLRIWPFPYNVARIAVNTYRGIRFFLLQGDLRRFFRLAAEFLNDLGRLYGTRRAVSIRTMRLFRRLQKYPSAHLPE
jgi:GT2 family glycosyltransferase